MGRVDFVTATRTGFWQLMRRRPSACWLMWPDGSMRSCIRQGLSQPLDLRNRSRAPLFPITMTTCLV